jgi:hypothetical protein
MTTNTVAACTAVVKFQSDDPCSHPWHHRSVAPTTLQERIQWILANRFDGNASEMSRRCGLARAHINLILKRSREEGPPRILDDTARKIASASGVSLQWLVEGVEPRDPDSFKVSADEQYPNRADAVEAARRLKSASEEAIALVTGAEYSGASEWTAQDWYDEIMAAERRLRRGGPAGRVVHELDEAPPGIPKRKGKR